MCVVIASFSFEACRAKEVFRKYVDSILQKSARIRSLIADLRRNYHEDETAMKYLSNKNQVYLIKLLSTAVGFHKPQLD